VREAKRLFILAAAAWAAMGCSAIQAIQEPANTVATVQRMNNIEQALNNSERLLLATPVYNGDSWLDEMEVTQRRGNEIAALWKETPGGSVQGIKITWPDVLAYAWQDVGREAPADVDAAAPVALDSDLAAEKAPSTGTEELVPQKTPKKEIINPYEDPKKKGIENPYDQKTLPGEVVNPYESLLLPRSSATALGAKQSGEEEPAAAQYSGAPAVLVTGVSAAPVPAPVADNLIALLGGRVVADFTVWKGLVDKGAATEGEIQSLEDEADRDGTPASRKSSIEDDIEMKKVFLDDTEEKTDAAFDTLLATMETARIDCGNKPLLKKTLKAFRYMNVLYGESAAMSVVLLYHYAKALPNIANEIEPAIKGWVNQSLREQGVKNPIEASSKMQFKLKFKGLGEPPTIGIEGVTDLLAVDPVKLVSSVTQKAVKFVGDVILFPGKFGIVMSKIAKQRKFISAATDLVEGQCGIEAPALVEVNLAAAADAAVSASGAGSVSAGTR